jgi:hypothetical protein
MKNDPNEIHFDCPKCKRPMSGDKALLGEMINCPDCNESFYPIPGKPTPSRAEKIRNQADRFTVAAGLFCGLGLLLALSQLARAISGEEGAGSGFIVAASLIGTSLWLYLIGQIIHIRANTEKEVNVQGDVNGRKATPRRMIFMECSPACDSRNFFYRRRIVPFCFEVVRI